MVISILGGIIWKANSRRKYEVPLSLIRDSGFSASMKNLVAVAYLAPGDYLDATAIGSGHLGDSSLNSLAIGCGVDAIEHVRRGNDGPHTVGGRDAAHFDGFIERDCSIVRLGKNMAMNVGHPDDCGQRLSCTRLLKLLWQVLIILYQSLGLQVGSGSPSVAQGSCRHAT